MQNCSTACGDITLVGNPTADCQVDFRYDNIDRLVFKGCDVDLPNPETNIGLKTLYDSGLIVFSSPLANVTLGDPTVEELQYADCGVPYQLITGRQLTAEDRIRISVTDGSPAITANYRDFAFWQDKMDKQVNLHFGVAKCSGDITWARDKDGNFLRISVLVFVNQQRPSNNAGKFIEFKNIQINANGDFLALYNVPTMNWINAGIVL